MSDDLITSDHPLSPAQQRQLSALLDTLLPASEDGRMPSAAQTDLLAYLGAQAADFIPALTMALDSFDDGFAELELEDRYPLVEAFREAQPALFDGLLAHVYACYYQDHRVLEGIGVGAGPPFPRGNAVDAGDLSLLDPVIDGSKTYRK